MSDIHTNYIDFRDEHRIYLLYGLLEELVGMIADSDYDERNENAMSDSSPITWYKFIVNPKYMFDGGHYKEGELPPIFAHRGDVLTGYQLMNYLINNDNDEPICLLEELEGLGLTAELSERECSIQICLVPLWNRIFRVESNIGFPLMFISEPKDNCVVLEANEKKITCSLKKLIIDIGNILYALREYFHKPTIDISDIFLMNVLPK